MFLLLSILVAVFCDIPVHCEFPQIAGSWTFFMTEKNHNGSCVTRECDIQAHITTTLTKTITLEAPNLAYDENGYVGTWTLIYDQGFELVMQSERYLVYFKYTENPNGNAVNFTSHCDETLVGWYHRDVIKARKWGCFYAKKNKKVEKVTYPREYFYPSEENEVFSNDEDLVNSINADISKTWKAKLYPDWDGVSERMFGKPTHPNRVESHKRHMEFFSRFHPKRGTKSYPKEFDWRNQSGVNFVSPVRAQLMCGSCYAFSAMAMFEARQRIMTNNEYQPIYSPQDVLDCSQFSQGCDGGFAYLISKYAMDFGIVEEDCDPYRGQSGQCTDKFLCKKRTYAYNYHYVGGYYGATNEENMMSDLIERGPMSVNIQVYPDLKQYKEGVYTCPKSVVDAPTPKWLPTDHVVTIVGYGEENGVKYWAVKNSWGTRFGNEGYFNIRKGSNECDIETLVISAEIVNSNDMV